MKLMNFLSDKYTHLSKWISFADGVSWIVSAEPEGLDKDYSKYSYVIKIKDADKPKDEIVEVSREEFNDLIDGLIEFRELLDMEVK